jgi:hypothetical protein
MERRADYFTPFAAHRVWRRGQLLGSSTITVGFVLLNIRPDRGGNLHVVIPSDGMGIDDFRHLRVWLRWGPRPAGEEADKD